MRAAGAEVPARAALAGNPSDGYGGRTLAVTIPAWRARVEVSPGAARIDPPDEAGNALRRAAINRFGISHDFTVRWATTIPRQVGLAGSSALITAALKAIAIGLGEPLEPDRLALLAWQTETLELGIVAGPQDRVVQAHGGLVAMDFDPEHGEIGKAEVLDPQLLPPLFVAWQRLPSKPSHHYHAALRRRHAEGDEDVHQTLTQLAGVAGAARHALVARDHAAFAHCLDASFELRRRLGPLDPEHVALIECARDHGAAANYAGSGGAIVGTLPSDPEPLRQALAAQGCGMLAPALGR
jgi:glucuronokinase